MNEVNIKLKPNVGFLAERKNKLKLHFPSITEADLNYSLLNMEEKLAQIGMKFGISREDLNYLMASL